MPFYLNFLVPKPKTWKSIVISAVNAQEITMYFDIDMIYIFRLSYFNKCFDCCYNNLLFFFQITRQIPYRYIIPTRSSGKNSFLELDFFGVKSCSNTTNHILILPFNLPFYIWDQNQYRSESNSEMVETDSMTRKETQFDIDDVTGSIWDHQIDQNQPNRARNQFH